MRRRTPWAAIERALANKVPPAGALTMIDAPALLEICDEDPALLDHLRATLLERLPCELEQLEHAFEARDFRRLENLAHEVKGMVVNFSFSVGQIVSTLEDAAAAHDVENARLTLRRLRELAPAFTQALEAASIDTLRAAAGAG